MKSKLFSFPKSSDSLFRDKYILPNVFQCINKNVYVTLNTYGNILYPAFGILLYSRNST